MSRVAGCGKIGESEMKNWKPFFIESSKIPVWLSYLAPINIWAITIFFLVFCRGEMDEETKRHETIHFQQTLETGVIGMVILYLWDYVHGYIKYRDGAEAYRRIRAEQEAYQMASTPDYLASRPRFSWIKKYHV